MGSLFNFLDVLMITAAVLKLINFKRQVEFLLNQLWDLWSIARNVPSLMSKFYHKSDCTTVVEIPTNYFKVHSSICVPKKHFWLGLPGRILRTWVGLISRYNNFFFMLGFFPFLSWWGILANIEQRKKGCLAISFLTLIQLVFDLLLSPIIIKWSTK